MGIAVYLGRIKIWFMEGMLYMEVSSALILLRAIYVRYQIWVLMSFFEEVVKVSIMLINH